MKIYEKISLAVFMAASLAVLCAAFAMTTLHGSWTWTVTLDFGDQPVNPLSVVLPASSLQEPPHAQIPVRPSHKPVRIAAK